MIQYILLSISYSHLILKECLLVLHDSFFFLHDSSIHSKLVVEMDNDGQSCNNTFSINDCQFRYMIYC